VSALAAPTVFRCLVLRIEGVVPPLPLYRAHCDAGRRAHTLLLESADPGSGRPQRSMVMLSAALSITGERDCVTVAALNPNGQALLPVLAAQLVGSTASEESGTIRVNVAAARAVSVEHERLRAPATLDVLRTLTALLQSGLADLPESVFLAGLMSYDLIGQFEQLPSPDGAAPDVADFRFYLADRLVVVDHARRRSEVIALVLSGASGEEQAARDDIARITEWAADAVDLAGDDADEPGGAGSPGSRPEAEVDLDDGAFAELVSRLQRHIVAGDVFQIVPSRTFSVQCDDPLAAYEELRRRDPVPYLFYVNVGDLILFGASPESALRVDGPAGTVEVSPIAGTRPRGRASDGRLDPELDTRLEAELRLDPKEQAEHLMLVDLARNDVARVSRPGTRQVTELMRIRRYERVMHLVSRVQGELADGLDALHACRAVLPMGTLTGAPKRRAMELLRTSEPGYRGLYGGAVGYLLGDGSLDMAIVIRAAVVRAGVARVRAGAGVVHDSIPLREAEETRRKAEAVLGAIAAATARHAGGSDGR
jgi:anthranilate synthase component 1